MTDYLLEVARNIVQAAEALKPKVIQPKPRKPALSARRVIKCITCERFPDFYMVHDSVWQAANLKRDENCCFPCLEKRLDRPLTIADFTTAPCNRGFAFFFLKGAAYSKDSENEHG